MTNTHAERYQQITEILARHGLGFLVGAAGLQRWVPFERGLLGHEQRAEPYTNPEHLRLALEQLGPVFVKLGLPQGPGHNRRVQAVNAFRIRATAPTAEASR